MQLIENHNCVATCNQRFCDTEEEYCEIVEMKGMELFMVLCKKHMEQWEGFEHD